MTRAAIVLLALLAPDVADAYLKFGVTVNGRDVELKWRTTPVRYAVADRGVPGVSSGDFQAAVGRAFATWEAVPSATITYQFTGYTSLAPGRDDGVSTLGFLAEPDLDRVLAATSFLIDDVTGELLEVDIFFNSIFSWSTATPGTTGRHDLESVAVHEIGHLSGLGHSMIGETEPVSGGRRVLGAETVMFPIAFGTGNTAGRTLRADDVAGISDLYPSARFGQTTGSVSGRVTRNGAGLLGAHVVAFNAATGALVGTFTLSRGGDFVIAGLSPGSYVLRVEPLDDADVESFFDPPIDVNFRPAFFDRLVSAPRGGDSGAVTIAVQPK